jgi:serine/threonine protein kinase
MDGGTLESKIGEVGVEEALWVSGRVADGVYHGHRHGVAHLDIKPTNVLLRETGAGTWDYPKVSDWGLAKMLLDHSNSIEGISPTYAAPEQFDSEQYGTTDDITDVYQIGAVAYALLTGEPPFTGSSAAVMQGVLQEEPTPPSVANPDVPREVDEVVMKALSKEKEDRYESSVILRKELEGLFEGYVDGSLGASAAAGATAGGSAASGGSADRGRSGSDRKTGEGTGTGRKETSDSRTEPRSTAEAKSHGETDRRGREQKDSPSDGGVLTRRRALGLLGVGAVGVGGWWFSQTGENTSSSDRDPNNGGIGTNGGSENPDGGETEGNQGGEVNADGNVTSAEPVFILDDELPEGFENEGATRTSRNPPVGDYAWSFDGDSYIRTNYVWGGGQTDHSGTLCTWVYIPSSETNNDGSRQLLGAHDGGSTGDFDGEILGLIQFGGGDGVGIYKRIASESRSVRTSDFPVNEWFHLAAVIDKSQEEIRTYINGELVSSSSDFDLGDMEQEPVFAVGAQGKISYGDYEFNSRFVGRLDDVRIYEEALTAEEIQNLVNRG